MCILEDTALILFMSYIKVHICFCYFIQRTNQVFERRKEVRETFIT